MKQLKLIMKTTILLISFLKNTTQTKRLRMSGVYRKE